MNIKRQKTLKKCCWWWTTIFFFNSLYMGHEMNRNQSKDYNIESHRITKIFLSSCDDENINTENIRMHIVGYPIFS